MEKTFEQKFKTVLENMDLSDPLNKMIFDTILKTLFVGIAKNEDSFMQEFYLQHLADSVPNKTLYNQ